MEADATGSPMPAADPNASTAGTETLRRLVASLLVVRCSGHLSDGQRRYPRWELVNADLQRLLAAGVGGVILLGGSAAELRLRTRQLRAWAGSDLLLCADVEEGVGQRFEGASWLVPPLALGRLHGEDRAAALTLAERYGRCTGREAAALGLNWVLGPVCDVNNNPANPVINVRAWGEDPASAGALAAAFVRGAQAEGVLCCAKHFPGHGDTSTDSHLDLPVLPHSRERLEAIELPPFRQAIAADVAAVMTAHLQLPALDPHLPATLSAPVLTDLLRRDLGFGGLVVTDALVMEAIAGRHGAGEAAVLALAAGADLVLMPEDADTAIDAILAALADGRLALNQLQASAERRRAALARRRCGNGSGNDGGDDGGERRPLGILSNGPLPEDRALALELVQRSLRRRGGATVTTAGGGLNLIRIDGALGCPFLAATAPALAWPAQAGLHTVLLDGAGPSPWRDGNGGPLDLERLGDGPVLLQLFVRGNPFRGSASGQEPWPAVIQQLQEANRLAGLAVYGSPYLWESLTTLLDEDIPAAWSPGQMPLAQAQLLASLGLEPAAAAAAGQGAPAAATDSRTAAVPPQGPTGFTD
jgi:beta-glucosidase